MTADLVFKGHWAPAPLPSPMPCALLAGTRPYRRRNKPSLSTLLTIKGPSRQGANEDSCSKQCSGMLTTSVALLHCCLSLAGTCVSMTALWGENKTCSGGYMGVLQNRCFLHALKTCEVWVLVLLECWHTASFSFNLSPILREEADGQQVQRAQVSGRQCFSAQTRGDTSSSLLEPVLPRHLLAP